MHEPAIVDAVLRLAAKPAKECLLCYLGTATYDLAANREKQVSGFRSRGQVVRRRAKVAQQAVLRRFGCELEDGVDDCRLVHDCGA